MIIVHKPTFSKQLKQIIPNNPTMYAQSQYFDNKNIRDMTYKKYTIIYRIRPIKKEIEFLRIFNKNKPTT